MKISNSIKMFTTAQELMPGGVNSPVRAFDAVGGQPIYFNRAYGSYLFDIDDNKYLDFVCGWGCHLLGHANEKIIQAITNAANLGVHYGAPHTLEIELAQLIKNNLPFIDKLRFTNSGTEAVQAAIRLARAYSKKNKIIKFSGCYHGHCDYLLVKAGSGATTLSMPDSAGVPKSFIDDTLIVEFNDLDQLSELLGTQSNEIAAIIIEPITANMGVVFPNSNFLVGIRQLTEQYGVLLIFDEIVNAFRVNSGSASNLFNIEPDIITLGKIIGGGLPIGCFGASSEIMQLIAPLGPVYQGGTFCGNPLVMAAGKATLEQLTATSYILLQEKSNYIVENLLNICAKLNIPFQIQNSGGLLGMFFLAKKVTNYEQALKLNKTFYAQFFHQMLIRGIYIAPSAFEAIFITLEHKDEQLNDFLNAFEDSLKYLIINKINP